MQVGTSQKRGRDADSSNQNSVTTPSQKRRKSELKQSANCDPVNKPSNTARVDDDSGKSNGNSVFEAKLSHSTLNKLKSFSAEAETTVNFEEIKKKARSRQHSDPEDQEPRTSCGKAVCLDDLEASDDEVEAMPGTSKLESFTRVKPKPAKAAGKQDAKSSGAKGKVKYTPLEQQFMAIKEKYQDAILFVECGYKYRFFGEDAEVSKVKVPLRHYSLLKQCMCQIIRVTTLFT